MFRRLFICCIFAPLVFVWNGSWTTQPQGWEDHGCDTLRTTRSLRAYDAVVPFRLTDTLRTKPVGKVYWVVKAGENYEWAAVTANKGEHAWQLAQPMTTPSNWAVKTLNWQEVEYLWSLAETPRYLYDRWDRLLAPVREDFLAKRDSVVKNMPLFFPGYTARVYSDLRQANTQNILLNGGKSASPVSHHQLGLAADLHIYRKGRSLGSYQTFKKLDSLATRFGLTWGGSFKGFIDPNHIQFFLNSSQMLQKYPDLRFEYEPFRKYYLNRVHKFIEMGKEDKAQDTQDLLTTMNQLRMGEPCTCEKVNFLPNAEAQQIQQTLTKMGYRDTSDLLLVGNLNTQTLTMITASQFSLTQKLGRWQ